MKPTTEREQNTPPIQPGDHLGKRSMGAQNVASTTPISIGPGESPETPDRPTALIPTQKPDTDEAYPRPPTTANPPHATARGTTPSALGPPPPLYGPTSGEIEGADTLPTLNSMREYDRASYRYRSIALKY